MTDQTLDPQIHIHDLGQRARKAARGLLSAGTQAKNTALREAARALRSRIGELLEANGQDVKSVEGKKPESFIDRLRLTEDRIEGMANLSCDTIPEPSLSQSDYDARFDAFAELIGAAFSCDITRVVTLSLGEMPTSDFGWDHLTDDVHKGLENNIRYGMALPSNMAMYQRFVDVVDAGRKKLDRAGVLELADGRVFSGVEAARVGLVDRTGYIDDAVAELSSRLGSSQKKPTLIRYTRGAPGGANIYTRGGTRPAGENSLTLRLDGLHSSPGIYYLWKPGL